MSFTGDYQVDLINGLIRVQTEQTALLGRLRYLKQYESLGTSREELADTISALARLLLEQTELLGKLRSARLYEAVRAQQEHERSLAGSNEQPRARRLTEGESVRILEPSAGQPIWGIVTLIQGTTVRVTSFDNVASVLRRNQVVVEDLPTNAEDRQDD